MQQVFLHELEQQFFDLKSINFNPEEQEIKVGNVLLSKEHSTQMVMLLNCFLFDILEREQSDSDINQWLKDYNHILQGYVLGGGCKLLQTKDGLNKLHENNKKPRKNDKVVQEVKELASSVAYSEEPIKEQEVILVEFAPEQNLKDVEISISVSSEQINDNKNPDEAVKKTRGRKKL